MLLLLLMHPCPVQAAICCSGLMPQTAALAADTQLQLPTTFYRLNAAAAAPAAAILLPHLPLLV
jgi:hypothetical protein